MTYERVPLSVQVVMKWDGTVIPQSVLYYGLPYKIAHIVSVRRFCPRLVPCIAPIEYTVVIDGVLKCIYFEEDTNKWFSVKRR